MNIMKIEKKMYINFWSKNYKHMYIIIFYIKEEIIYGNKMNKNYTV